jgi:outer membrane protein TolC
MRMRPVSSLLPFFVALSLLPAMPARAIDAPASTLAELEDSAQHEAVEMRLSDADIDAMSLRLDAARASEGLQLQASTALINASEALSDTTSHIYQRVTGAVGLRYPVLGSREAQRRNTAEAADALAQAQQARELARTGVLRLVRTAAVDEWHGRERAALARAYLATRDEAQSVLTEREQRREMLPAESRGLLTLYDVARSELARDEAARDEALSSLRRATGLANVQPPATAPAFAVDCLDPQAVRAQADTRPAIAAAKAEVAFRQQRSEDGWSTVEAGVSVAQTLSHDFGGQPGYSTSVGVDVSMPLNWRAARQARAAAAHAELARAEAALDQRRQEDVQDVERAFRQLALRAEEVEVSARVLQAAREEWRVARTRLAAGDGDAIGRAMHARHALFLSALEDDSARQRLEIAQVTLLALASPCPAASAAPASLESGPGVGQELGLGLGSGKSSAKATAPRGAAALSAPGAASATSPEGLAWFVWNAEALADPERAIAALPDGSRRLWISFSAPRLRALAAGAERAAFERLIAAAHARHIEVRLLLGEPTYALPAGRTQLVSLLPSLRGLDLDGLVLDLERSQLKPAVAARPWQKDVLATVAAAQAAAPRALALVTHPRDLADAVFLEQLRAAGVDEVVPMIYGAGEARTVELTEKILDADPALGVVLAQSIEPGLAASPATAPPGRAEALARWHRLAAQLARHANFHGVAVQSLEDFSKAQP